MIIQAPVPTRTVISIEPETTQVRPRTTIPSHDLRNDGLQSAGRLLRANVANLDIVFVARARSDVSYCPVCPAPHPA